VLERVGYDHSDALPEVMDRAVLEGDEVLLGEARLLRRAELRRVEMRDYGEHARRLQRRRGVDGANRSARDRRHHEDAVRHVVEVVLGRVACAAGDFFPAVDAGRVLLRSSESCDASGEVAERADERPLRQLDLESVLPVVLRPLQRGFRCIPKIRGRRGFARERRLRFAQAPRFRPDAAEREARGADGVACEIESDRRRRHREFVRRAIAHFQIRRAPRVRRVGDEERCDQLTFLEIVLEMRRVAGEQMKVGRGDVTLAVRTAKRDHAIECREGHREVGRMRGDARRRSADDRMSAVFAIDCRAAAAGIPLCCTPRTSARGSSCSAFAASGCRRAMRRSGSAEMR